MATKGGVGASPFQDSDPPGHKTLRQVDAGHSVNWGKTGGQAPKGSARLSLGGSVWFDWT